MAELEDHVYYPALNLFINDRYDHRGDFDKETTEKYKFTKKGYQNLLKNLHANIDKYIEEKLENIACAIIDERCAQTVIDKDGIMESLDIMLEQNYPEDFIIGQERENKEIQWRSLLKELKKAGENNEVIVVNMNKNE